MNLHRRVDDLLNSNSKRVTCSILELPYSYSFRLLVKIVLIIDQQMSQQQLTIDLKELPPLMEKPFPTILISLLSKKTLSKTFTKTALTMEISFLLDAAVFLSI